MKKLFSKEDKQMVKKYRKYIHTTKEIQLKIIIKYHLTPGKIAIIKNTNTDKYL